jgi:hypothetical protein
MFCLNMWLKFLLITIKEAPMRGFIVYFAHDTREYRYTADDELNKRQQSEQRTLAKSPRQRNCVSRLKTNFASECTIPSPLPWRDQELCWPAGGLGQMQCRSQTLIDNRNSALEVNYEPAKINQRCFKAWSSVRRNYEKVPLTATNDFDLSLNWIQLSLAVLDTSSSSGTYDSAVNALKKSDAS